jgi:NitT/TauT family transport system permease protein
MLHSKFRRAWIVECYAAWGSGLTVSTDRALSVETCAGTTTGQVGRVRRFLLWLLASPLLRGIALPAALLLVWQLLVMGEAVSATFLPAPSAVAHAWWTWVFGARTPLTWTSGTFLDYSWLSIRRALLGFAIGGACGVTIGILIGWFRVVSDFVDPLVQALRPIPQTAWLPFATLLFGIQEKAAIFLIAMGCFFPVVLNTASGARQTPRLLVRAARMLGTSRAKVLWRVVIPSALPSIVTGLRLGLGLAWVLVIVAEMLAVRGGLGYAIWSAYTFIRMDLIIAAIITIGFYGWLTDRILVVAAGRLMRWQHGLVK